MNANNWIEISLSIDSILEEVISDYLFELGSVGSYTSDRTLYAYFREQEWTPLKLAELQTHVNQLPEFGFQVASSRIGVNYVAEKDWNEIWKRNLRPIFVLPDLIIKPSWAEFTPPEKALVIEIDPQMAFGTGAHATTQLVLRLLKKYLHPQSEILDIGTGSGILAIAAAKMTGSRVFAFDNDPIAVSTARSNVQNNSAISHVYLFTGTIRCIRNKTFDLILANINRNVIAELLPSMLTLLREKGILVLSGIMDIELDRLFEQFKELNLTILLQEQQDEWMGLALQRMN